eukprot:sb/3472469/
MKSFSLSKPQESTETSKQPIRTRYLGNVIGYQPIRDHYFLFRTVPASFLTREERSPEIVTPAHSLAAIVSSQSVISLLSERVSERERGEREREREREKPNVISQLSHSDYMPDSWIGWCHLTSEWKISEHNCALLIVQTSKKIIEMERDIENGTEIELKRQVTER